MMRVFCGVLCVLGGGLAHLLNVGKVGNEQFNLDMLRRCLS